MGAGVSSVIKSGVSEVNQANIELNRDKPLQIFKVSSLVALFVSIIIIVIGALTAKKKSAEKTEQKPAQSDEKEPAQPSGGAITLYVGLGLLLLSIISLILYRYIAAIKHPKAFAVMETASMVTSVI